MFTANLVIGTNNRALEKAEDVLNGVCVNIATHPFFITMAYCFMSSVVVCYAFVSRPIISVYRICIRCSMWQGNTTPYWGTSWGDAENPLPEGVTFSQIQDGDDFVYAVSMSYAILEISDGDTFSVQIKARDFNDDFVQSYTGYEGYDGYDGYDGEYSKYRGLWITDTGEFEVTLPQPVIEVEIDIKPGSDPNSINLKSKGVVPVAVLSDGFDASAVNPDTVVFAGASPVRWTLEDVDDDGNLDLLLHFKTQELNLDEDSTEAVLTGETNIGQPIAGTDTVNIVPKGKGK